MRSVLAFLFVALALTVPSAFAGPSVKYGDRGGTLSPGPLNTLGDGYRSTSLDPVTDATILRDVIEATIEGQKAAMAARRSIPLSRALAIGARALGPLGTAATLYNLYKDLRCTSSPSGFSLSCDEGITPGNPWGGYTYRSGSYSGPDPFAAAARYAAENHGGGSGYSVLNTYVDGYGQRWVEFRYTDGFGRLQQIAVIGFPNGEPAGVACTAGPDGKCAGGVVRSLSPEEAAARVLPYASPQRGLDAVREALGRGVDVSPEADVLPATGPSKVTASPKQTILPSGDVITETTEYNITYQGDTYTYNIVNTTTNNTTNQTTTTTQQPEPKCGVSGKPPCTVKVDEEGTPSWKDRDGSGLDALKAAEAVKRDELMGQVPQPDLGWFGAPPIAECAPFEFPNNMGSLNPCGVVNQTREVMAYLWALAAAWLSFGMIRKAATGGS